MLKHAIINKFFERETYKYLENIEKCMYEFENSEDLKEIWKNYQNKFSYAEDISYQDTINAIKEFIKIVTK